MLSEMFGKEARDNGDKNSEDNMTRKIVITILAKSNEDAETGIQRALDELDAFESGERVNFSCMHPDGDWSAEGEDTDE